MADAENSERLVNMKKYKVAALIAGMTLSYDEMNGGKPPALIVVAVQDFCLKPYRTVLSFLKTHRPEAPGIRETPSLLW